MKPYFASIHPATGGGFDAAETGVAVDVSAYDQVSVVITGTFVGTVLIEVSMDGGTTWATYPSGSFTAPGVLAVTATVQQIRARCSAFTSGLILTYVGAKDIYPHG